MIRLRKLGEHDVPRIREWPAYPEDMAQMDYALRENGWLHECGRMPEAACYAVEENENLVGFSILSKTGDTEAEFRIALRADKTGQGLGKAVTFLTLQSGFTELGFERIHLIVRKNNSRGIRLYQRMGFVGRGDCRKEINGSMVDFRMMDIGRDDFKLQGGDPLAAHSPNLKENAL